MVMYENEFEIKENTIQIKEKLNHSMFMCSSYKTSCNQYFLCKLILTQ